MTYQFRFLRAKSHYFTSLILAFVFAGMGPLGTTNSRAPPEVLPRPTNPGSILLTGEATPRPGVGNSITLNPVGLSGIVRRSAISCVLIPRMSSAAVERRHHLRQGDQVFQTFWSLECWAQRVPCGMAPGSLRPLVLVAEKMIAQEKDEKVA